MLNNGIFVFETSSLVTEIFKFLFLKLMTNRLSTKINHKIKNISGNIGVIFMLLKLGTNNVPRVRNKMTLTVPFSWQTILLSGLFLSVDALLFCLYQKSFIPNELVRKRRAIWTLCAF